MKTIETCISPDLLDLHEFANKTVIVVDIFRASSTMVTALSNGVNIIVPVKDLEQCKAYKKEDGLLPENATENKPKGLIWVIAH